MSKISRNSQNPKVPLDWITHSCSKWRDLHFTLLEPNERLFLKKIISRSLFSRDEFVDILHECFSELLQNLNDDSLSRNLFSGECYADRVFFDSSGNSLGSIRVFRLGLIVAVPMPAKGTRFKHWYCYPTMSPGFQLTRKNYVRPYPPHNPFSSWCFRELRINLSEDECMSADTTIRKLTHWNDSGDYITDHCLRYYLDGRWKYFWFEVHTGSEGYDETIFIKRLLTAESSLRNRGKYVVIVPFKRDRDKAIRAIKKYNSKAQNDDEKPLLDLQVSEIITYQGIPQFKEKLGFYEHKKRM